jgi:hypothetical protein
LDLKGYKLGQALAVKQAGLGDLLGGVASGAGSLFKSTNPWVRNAVVGAGFNSGINALVAPQGHKMDAAARGIVPGAIGGLAYHGISRGTEHLFGAPMVPGKGVGAAPERAGIFRSLKGLVGKDPGVSRTLALKNLGRGAGTDIGAMVAIPHIMTGLGVNPVLPQYPEEPKEPEQYTQQRPFLVQ